MSLAKNGRTARALAGCAVALLLGSSLWMAKRLGLKARVLRWWMPASSAAPPAASEPFAWPSELTVKTWVYRGGLAESWQDWGWSRRDPRPGGPLRSELCEWGGVRLVHQDLAGEYGGLSFRYRAPRNFGRFLQLQLATHTGVGNFPWVDLGAPHEREASDGWVQVFVPIEQLNPDEFEFTQLVFMANKELPRAWVELDEIGLTKKVARPARELPTRPLALSVRCDAPARHISELIYGIGMAQEQTVDDVWWLGATARRWGGNPTSRYNWRLGNAWNTGSDWFFENVDYLGDPKRSYRDFLAQSAAHGLKTALTLPMLGWVAKDTSSSSFPKTRFPVQDAFDPWRPEAGNGQASGKPVAPPSPTLTSVAAPPEFVKAWVWSIRAAEDGTGARSVHQYILDNEPNLWSSTHRDVHPEPLTYDELLARTIAYGTAVRAVDPEAVIAGPAEWGWTNYFYSAKDLEHGPVLPVDRLKHGGTALIPWYLRELAEHERRTGVKILDLLDLHFYPEGVYSPAKDRASAALRLRSTRSLWDPSYQEESWIGEPVRLLPRMREWIDENYPGLGISIGEWNFGGEGHMSGALAVAEALGRFGTHGVSSAFYWTFPKAGSPAGWAFRAYRNFDGRGAHFEDWSVATEAEAGSSLFASRDRSGRRWVLVALNLEPSSAAAAQIRVCGEPGGLRAFVYDGDAEGFRPAQVSRQGGLLRLTLGPYSIAVIELSSP